MEFISKLGDIGRHPIPDYVAHIFKSFGKRGCVFIFSCYMYKGATIKIIYPRYVDMDVYMKFLQRIKITEQKFNSILEELENTKCEQLRDNPEMFLKKYKLIAEIITLGEDTNDIFEALDYRECNLYHLEMILP